MHLRHLKARLLNALDDTSVVCLSGASRTGKTTLMKAIQNTLSASPGPDFADPDTLALATRDPAGFLAGLPNLAFLDDVHRVPALLPCLRAAVDQGGRFFLTSTPQLSSLPERLAWRMETFLLWPLAQAERQGVFPGLIDAAFQGDPTHLPFETLDRKDLLMRLLTGGYPEVQDLAPSLREAWFHGYLATLLQGDFGHLTDLREVHHLTRLLTAPGAEPGRTERCLERLQSLQVVAGLPSRSGPPFRCFNDSGLQAHILGMGLGALEARPMLAAPLLETFAVMELIKTAPWSQSRPALHQWRAADGQPLVVLENHRRELVAVAVNASATVQAEAFRGLRELQGQAGGRLKAGLVLQVGGQIGSAGPGLWVVPFQALWAPRIPSRRGSDS